MYKNQQPHEGSKREESGSGRRRGATEILAGRAADFLAGRRNGVPGSASAGGVVLAVGWWVRWWWPLSGQLVGFDDFRGWCDGDVEERKGNEDRKGGFSGWET